MGGQQTFQSVEHTGTQTHTLQVHTVIIYLRKLIQKLDHSNSKIKMHLLHIHLHSVTNPAPEDFHSMENAATYTGF